MAAEWTQGALCSREGRRYGWLGKDLKDAGADCNISHPCLLGQGKREGLKGLPASPSHS